jgi:hypothetical protein
MQLANLDATDTPAKQVTDLLERECWQVLAIARVDFSHQLIEAG